MKYQEKRVSGYAFKFQEFDSITEFNEYIRTSKTTYIFRGDEASKDGSSSFCNTSCYEEAQELFDRGWAQAAEKISKKLPVQTNQQTTNRTKPTYNVVGAQASVPRYLQGIPTNMIDRKPVPQKQKIIVVNRSINFSAAISADTILEEGIKALQLVQTLENRGYRIKLNIVGSHVSGGEVACFRLCVKKPEERMSIIKVAFPLAHPSMLRRIGFRWLEVHPTLTQRSFRVGYGMPDTELIRHMIPSNEIFLPAFINNVEEFANSLNL